MGNTMKEEKWEKFLNTGLLVFVNSFLHIFGWAICIEWDETTKKAIRIYPAKVNFTGFSEKDNEEAYKKLNDHMISIVKDRSIDKEEPPLDPNPAQITSEKDRFIDKKEPPLDPNPAQIKQEKQEHYEKNH